MKLGFARAYASLRALLNELTGRSTRPAPGAPAGADKSDGALQTFINMTNAAPPLQLAKVQVSGIAANSGRPGDSMEVWVRYAATSEQLAFHRAAEGVLAVLQNAATASGHAVNVRAAGNVLAVIKPDETAELYLDSAAIVINARMKRDFSAGQPIMMNDVTDIIGVEFPAIDLAAENQFIFLAREGFRFSLYCDFTRKLDRGELERTIAAQLRQLKYHEAYAALSNPPVFEALTDAGWFPFIELQGNEFAQLYAAVYEGLDLSVTEDIIASAFPRERVEAMFRRWLTHAAFAPREPVLRSGIEAFLRQDPVAAIKTLSTEIEGILQDAHITAANAPGKMRSLIRFVADEAGRKAGGTSTLFFPEAFASYLTATTYGSFDPMAGNATATRHGAAHGAAPADAYNMKRALQAMLTLDQLSTYLQ